MARERASLAIVDDGVSARLPLLMLSLTTIVVVECTRVLFSVAYHAGESIGNLTSGLIVVALFAVPALAAPLRRVVPPSALLVASVAALVAGRIVVQLVGEVGLALAGGTTAAGLLALVLGTVAARRHTTTGGTGVAVAITLGAAGDTLLRATGTTWDIVWRHDALAWGLSVALLGGLVATTVATVRSGVVPDGEGTGAALAEFLVWPYLYVVLLYAQNPAFFDSSAHVRYWIGLGLAVAAAALAVPIIVLAARRGLTRIEAVATASGLAVVGFLLPVVTGLPVVALAWLAQAGAAALLGSASGSNGAAAGDDHEIGHGHDGIARSAMAFAGGGVWVAIGILAYALHTIQPLPFSNRFVPAAIGLSMVVATFASPHRDPRARALTSAATWAATGALAGLAVAVPLLVVGLWPDTPHPDVTARPIRVLTFNIEQGLTLGQLHLDQLAGYVEQADPDVVVLQEVGRGWALSGMTDGGEWFSRRLGMPFVWGPAADNQFGNIVMSRLPITDQEVLALGKGHGTQDRSAILVTLDLGSGRDLGVIGTHLMNGSSAPMHETRAQAYRDILDTWAGRPRTVFLGDLNTYPRDVPPGWPELNIPLDAGFRTNQDVDECTMPTSNQNCPDWIFVTSDLAQSPVTIVVDRPDHRPITAEVTPSP